MCGNGIRCLAKYVVDHDLVDEDRDEIVVDTLVGAEDDPDHPRLRGHAVPRHRGHGRPILDPAPVPTTIDDDMVVDCPDHRPNSASSG